MNKKRREEKINQGDYHKNQHKINTKSTQIDHKPFDDTTQSNVEGEGLLSGVLGAVICILGLNFSVRKEREGRIKKKKKKTSRTCCHQVLIMEKKKIEKKGGM